MSTEHTDIIRRIYLRGGRMDVGTPGDGDRSRDYRVRWLGHIMQGCRARRADYDTTPDQAKERTTQCPR